MKMNRSLLAIVLLLVVVPMLNVHADDNREIRIGAIVSSTGIAANYGQNIRRGIELAAEKLKAQGVPLTVIFEDDGTDPKSTVAAFKKLELQKVDAVLGSSWAFTTNAAIPVAAAARIPLISTSNLPESLNLSEGGGYAFNIAWPITTEVAPFEKFLDRTKPKSAAILYDLTSWGQLQRRYYKAALDARGIRVLNETETAEKGANNWNSVVTKLRSLNPETVVLLLDPSDIGTVVKIARQQKLNSSFFGSISSYQIFNESAYKAVFNDLCFTYPYEQLRSNKEFYDSYKTKFGAEPESCADTSYDAVGLVADSVLKARKENRPLVDVLRTTSYLGVVGKYQFDPLSSISAGQLSLVCIRNGELRVE